MPVYKGADLIDRALDCLQQQTFRNFEVIISVDGNDAETAAACRPFLADPRFRMVVQTGRLDWVGNFNWLLQQDLSEFFCYRQHDDTTAPEFFETLLRAADKEPDAVAVYCDCLHEYGGKSRYIESAPSIEGDPRERILQYIERIPAPPVRGLIRSNAIRQTDLIRFDEFRGPHQMYGWLAKLVRLGSFRRVPEPLYYKFDRPDSYTSDFLFGSQDRKRAAWSTIFTGLLDAAMPLCRTPEERIFFQQNILYRVLANPTFRPKKEVYSKEKLINECLERLRHEGNTRLLGADEIPQALHFLRELPELHEPSRIQRAIYQIRQRSRLGKLIYPDFRTRRATYQIRHLFEMTRNQLPKFINEMAEKMRRLSSAG